MVDIVIKVLEPATNFALMTLEEAKIALGISTTDTSQDAQLQFLIDTNSAVISAMMNNRVLAKEKVRETFRELQPARLFLSHWPVKETDIESVETPSGTILGATDYELEEGSGKILLLTNQTEPIVVTYTGGYSLPDEAPDALKQACGLLVGLTKGEQAAAQLTGIRMISHKESRVMFHSNTGGGGSSGNGAASQTRVAVANLLSHFTRHWV